MHCVRTFKSTTTKLTKVRITTNKKVKLKQQHIKQGPCFSTLNLHELERKYIKKREDSITVGILFSTINSPYHYMDSN